MIESISMAKCDRPTPLGICDIDLRTYAAAFKAASFDFKHPLRTTDSRLRDYDEELVGLPEPCINCRRRVNNNVQSDQT